MDISIPTPLLGGLSPQVFMRRHWQKKPLLIRQAVPFGPDLLSRAELFDLAARDDVESRLIVQNERGWSLRHGPLKRRALPPLARPGWTLLVQGLDLHVPAAHELLARFRFVPDARLDDAMLSYATDGGGVGPHVDSYDVFLLQVQGRRHWRIGRVRDPSLVPDVPLKILANFEPEQDWLLEAGDMLYLPPGWAHDGVADGECLTCSIGFRAPRRRQIAHEVLQRLLDGADVPDIRTDTHTDRDPLYQDPRQVATLTPGRIPKELQSFATDAVLQLAADPRALACALGEVLSEPKADVWFDAAAVWTEACDIALDRRTRMIYDDWHLFVNGEPYRMAGRDATLMRRLADERRLTRREHAALTGEARELLLQWAADGWLYAEALID